MYRLPISFLETLTSQDSTNTLCWKEDKYCTQSFIFRAAKLNIFVMQKEVDLGFKTVCMQKDWSDQLLYCIHKCNYIHTGSLHSCRIDRPDTPITFLIVFPYYWLVFVLFALYVPFYVFCTAFPEWGDCFLTLIVFSSGDYIDNNLHIFYWPVLNVIFSDLYFWLLSMECITG